MSNVGANSQANSQLPVDGLQLSISVESETSLPSQPPLSNQNILDVDDSDSSLATRKNPSFVWQHFKIEEIDGVWKPYVIIVRSLLGVIRSMELHICVITIRVVLRKGREWT